MSNITPEERPKEGGNAELPALMFQQLDAHSNIRERVARLEEAEKHFATKVEVGDLRAWALKSVVAALLAAVLSLVKLLFF